MLLRRIARPLFASWFIAEGLDVLRHPGPHAKDARAALDRLSRLTSQDLRISEAQLTTAVQAHGVAVAGAGLLLVLGKAPRTAALALAVLTAPLIVANLPDKAADAGDKPAAKARRDRLVRALSSTGGAILAAADREGRPGLAWRVQHSRDEHAAGSLD